MEKAEFQSLYINTSEYLPCSSILPVNISVGEGKKTTASSFYHPPELHGSERAVDGIGLNAMGTLCQSYYHSDGGDYNPWWEVDLDFVYQVLTISYLWRVLTGTVLIYKYSQLELSFPLTCILVTFSNRINTIWSLWYFMVFIMYFISKEI